MSVLHTRGLLEVKRLSLDQKLNRLGGKLRRRETAQLCAPRYKYHLHDDISNYTYDNCRDKSQVGGEEEVCVWGGGGGRGENEDGSNNTILMCR